jgi:hypothetical protein
MEWNAGKPISRAAARISDSLDTIATSIPLAAPKRCTTCKSTGLRSDGESHGITSSTRGLCAVIRRSRIVLTSSWSSSSMI